MSTKEYKAGMVAGAKPFGEKIEKIVQDINQVGNANRQAVAKVEKSIDAVYDYVEDREQYEQLGLKKQADILYLDKNERMLLIASLFQLGQHIGTPSEQQKIYFSCLKQHLGITGIQQEFDLLNIENLKDVDAQKIIFRSVLEYLYLETGTWSLDEFQQNFLKYFQVNEKTHTLFKSEIEREVNVVGVIGLSEKYEIPSMYLQPSLPKDTCSEPDAPKQRCVNETSTPIFDEALTATECDTDVDEYRMCKQIISSRLYMAFPSEAGKNRQKTQSQRMEQFRTKFAPLVVADTLVAFAEDWGPLTSKFLFTTSGLHSLTPLSNKAVFIRYADIDFSSTVIKRGKKESMPEALILTDGLNNVALEISGSDINYICLQSILIDLAKENTAVRDTPISVIELPEDAKVLYGKLMIRLCKNCGLDTLEALRISNELEISQDRFADLLTFAQDCGDNKCNDDLYTLLMQIPYPSKPSIGYALLQHMVVVIQYASGRVRDITAQETSFLFEIAILLGVTQTVLEKLIPVAQIPYRLLKRDITKKEISALGQALATVAAGVGLPIATIAGSSFLFCNTLWFCFIPGIGTVLAAAGIGIAATTAILAAIKESSSEFDPQISQEIAAVGNGYIALGEIIQDIYPSCDVTLDYIQKIISAADTVTYRLGQQVRAHFNLSPTEATCAKSSLNVVTVASITPEEDLAFRKNAAARQKEAAPTVVKRDERAKVSGFGLKVIDVSDSGEHSTLRVRVKILEAPIHIDDCCAFVSSSKVGKIT